MTLWEVEADFIRTMTNMREAGIKIDREFCEREKEKGEQVLEEIKEDLGWNPGSTKELGSYLIDKMKFPIIAYTAKGNPSFNKQALAWYDDLLLESGDLTAQKILRYRGWQKTVSANYKAYLEYADKNDIVRPNYKLHGTRTGRVSCEMPNLQQIPRAGKQEWNGKLKKAFIPRNEQFEWWYRLYRERVPDLTETTLWEFDYSQLELRLAAAVSKETDLLDAFKAGVDVFSMMAQSLGWKRQNVKTFYYATSYGAGTKKIAGTFGITEDDARGMIKDFYRQYRNLARASKRAEELVKQNGEIAYWTGRKRRLRPEESYKAFNAYIQGGAFEIVKRSLIRLDKLKKWPLVLTVHDSVVVEIPKEEANQENLDEIKRVLEDVPEAPAMGVSFKVDYGEWGK